MFTDLPLSALEARTTTAIEPADLDEFWASTIAESRAFAVPPVVRKIDSPLTAIDVYDITFSGYGGQPIRAWLRVPSGATGPLPTIVQYVGYGGGRGHATENLLVAASGFAHFHMDTRGQGASWSVGETPDEAPPAGPQVPGVMTKGIGHRDSYYYRRLMTDAVLAVTAASALEVVDSARIGVQGGSQGGALAIVAAAFAPEVRAAAVRVPFLSDFPRAITITDEYPFREITDYLRTHRDAAAAALATLAYFDTSLIAARATVPSRFSVGLMDATTPPSTVFAAYNAWTGEKSIEVWPYNGHEGGGPVDDLADLAFFARTL